MSEINRKIVRLKDGREVYVEEVYKYMVYVFCFCNGADKYDALEIDHDQIGEVVEDTYHWRQVMKTGQYIRFVQPVERGVDINEMLCLVEDLCRDEIMAGCNPQDKYSYMGGMMDIAKKYGLFNWHEQDVIGHYLARQELA